MQIELKKIEDNPKILEELSIETQELIITKNDQPIYKLTRINQPNKKRRHRGSAKGLIVMSDDFDEPLEEFEEYL
jgi:antitoxin (DNA-binding transcriptional repressor) of toxin-antitoxin stability system